MNLKLLFSLIFLFVLSNSASAQCSSSQSGITPTPTISGPSMPAYGTTHTITMGNANCASAPCNIEYMYVINPPGSSSVYTTVTSSPNYSLNFNQAGSWSIAGCVRAQGKSVWCETFSISPYVCDPTHSINLVGPTTGYRNAAASFSTNNYSGATYTWNVTGSPSVTTGSNNYRNYTWATTGTYTVSSTVTLSNGCSYTESITITILNCTTPTTNISGPSSGSTNATYTFTTPFVQNATYSWSTNGATGTSSSNIIALSWSTIGTKNISVTTTLGTCSATDNHSITLTACTPPNVVITGTRNATLNSSYTYSTSSVSGANYVWNTDGGTGSSSSNSISIAFNTTGNKTIGVTVSDNGCIASDTHLIVVPGGSSTCYTSGSHFENLSINTTMNARTITDAASTSITTSILNSPSNGNNITNFQTSMNTSRGGDTSIYLLVKPYDSTNNHFLMKAKFNRAVDGLNFCIRDIDAHSSKTSGYIDKVIVKPYVGTSIVIIPKGSAYIKSIGSVNIPYSNAFTGTLGATIANNNSKADVCFDFTGGSIDSVVLDFYNGGSYNSTSVLDIGISNFNWCTNTPLPVELIVFEARKIGNSVKLNWSTAMENNNAYFEIQKSVDLSKWESLDQVIGAGNSNQKINYEYIDFSSLQIEAYYRLKQVDFDGSINFSEIVTINNSTERGMSVYPNPSQGIISINADFDLDKIRINDIYGNTIIEEDALKGHQSTIDLRHLAKGIYFIIINDKLKMQVYSEKVVIK